MDEKKNRIYICTLFAINLFLHLFLLNSLNPYLNADEASLQYSAWCLGKYGTDRYGNSFPVLIANFYGAQSAAYAYLVVPFVKIMGMNMWSIRLPMALAYSFAIFPLYHLLINYTDKTMMKYTTLLYTFSPLMISMGRLGLDCNLIVPCSIFMLDTVVTAVESKSTGRYIIASIISGFVLYTYAISYLLIPVFLFVLFLFLIKKREITKKQIIAVIVTLGLISTPAILEIITLYIIKHNWSLGAITFISIPRNTSRELLKLNPANIVHSLSALIASDYFFSGKAKGYIFRSSQPFGRIYYNFFLISIPFFFYGIFITLKKAMEEWKENKIGINIVFLIHLCVGILLYGCMYYMLTYRIALLIPSALFMIGNGLSAIMKTNKGKLKLFIKTEYVVELTVFICIFFILNVSDKLADQRYSIANVPFSEELNFIKENNLDDNKEIYVISSSPGWIYIPISMNGASPEEVKAEHINDTIQNSKNDFTFKGIHTDKPDKIDDNNIYIVTKKYLQEYYADINLNFDTFERKDFPYYTVYWKEERS